MKEVKLTPMIKQFMGIKSAHPDKIVLFRMGDFYETFFEDAKKCSKILEITLTSRNKKNDKAIPLAGFPYHSLEIYLNKLIQAGEKVVICEQVEDPNSVKGLLKREIVNIITPGTVLDHTYLNTSKGSYLTAISREKEKIGLASIDVSTSDFIFTEILENQLINEIDRLSPAEILYFDEKILDFVSKIFSKEVVFSKYTQGDLNEQEAQEILQEHFSVLCTAGVVRSGNPIGTIAAAMALSYLKDLKKNSLKHISSLKYYSLTKFMQIDKSTARNLELTQSLIGSSYRGSFFSILDDTVTPMGKRLLKEWITRPLIDKKLILERQETVQDLIEKIQNNFDLRDILRGIGDLSRLISKISVFSINPPEVNSVCFFLESALGIKNILSNFDCANIKFLFDSIQDYSGIVKEIRKIIMPHPQKLISSGGIINQGVNNELDELRQISLSGKQWIAELEKHERERTKISNLKIKYNRVFGYYIEVSRRFSGSLPSDYTRKQTLVNCERFISPELKEYESKVLGAEQRIKTLEHEIFSSLKKTLHSKIDLMQNFAKTIALLDVYANFAHIAFHRSYSRPVLGADDALELKDSRHPVVEVLQKACDFIPNDTFLDNKKSKILIITGPNMAGKSTYLRQVALIAIMSQIGCFVPAKKAKIPIFDKVFSRVGASDNLAQGESTFLVEMLETAGILNFATPKSLIILDEIGRGTSTFDGLSLAWAIVEHIHNSSHLGCKTLFATHYHELTELEGILNGVKNYNVAVKKIGDRMIFLNKIVSGAAKQSYGIEVAGLAGLPKKVLDRAKEILSKLEKMEFTSGSLYSKVKQETKISQLDIFNDFSCEKKSKKDVLSDEIVLLLKEIKQMKINNITPMEALQKLEKCQRKLSSIPLESLFFDHSS